LFDLRYIRFVLSETFSFRMLARKYLRHVLWDSSNYERISVLLKRIENDESVFKYKWDIREQETEKDVVLSLECFTSCRS